MMQVGLDMPHTPTQIATWVSDCGNANKTVAARKAAQADIAALNALLVKNQLSEIKVEPTKMKEEHCVFKAQVVERVKAVD